MTKPIPRSDRWFDAHLDLAYLAEVGRDMHTGVDDCRGRYQPAAVTLPTLKEGRVSACLGTIFTEPVNPDDPNAEDGPFAYPAEDANAAWRAGMRQLKLYHAWRDAGLIELIPKRGSPPSKGASAPLRLGVLMEGADPITSPDEAHEWVQQGVIAVGLAWWTPSRYAGGNGATTGLTPIGRELVETLDRLGVVFDASHLSDASLDGVLEHASGPVIASHSNARALMEPGEQRHLTDEHAKEIARRGGVIGLNLCSRFLRPGIAKQDKERATIEDCRGHLEHWRDLVGPAHIGLGSDMDGGFAADRLPHEINLPGDLAKLADNLAEHGWSDEDIHGFAWGNWAAFWEI